MLTPCVGRDDVLDRLRLLLSSNRWVTLTGAPGCGKTLVARHTAAGEAAVDVGRWTPARHGRLARHGLPGRPRRRGRPRRLADDGPQAGPRRPQHPGRARRGRRHRGARRGAQRPRRGCRGLAAALHGDHGGGPPPRAGAAAAAAAGAVGAPSPGGPGHRAAARPGRRGGRSLDRPRPARRDPARPAAGQRGSAVAHRAAGGADRPRRRQRRLAGRHPRRRRPRVLRPARPGPAGVLPPAGRDRSPGRPRRPRRRLRRGAARRRSSSPRRWPGAASSRSSPTGGSTCSRRCGRPVGCSRERPTMRSRRSPGCSAWADRVVPQAVNAGSADEPFLAQLALVDSAVRQACAVESTRPRGYAIANRAFPSLSSAMRARDALDMMDAALASGDGPPIIGSQLARRAGICASEVRGTYEGPPAPRARRTARRRARQRDARPRAGPQRRDPCRDAPRRRRPGLGPPRCRADSRPGRWRPLRHPPGAAHADGRLRLGRRLRRGRGSSPPSSSTRPRPTSCGSRCRRAPCRPRSPGNRDGWSRRPRSRCLPARRPRRSARTGSRCSPTRCTGWSPVGRACRSRPSRCRGRCGSWCSSRTRASCSPTATSAAPPVVPPTSWCSPTAASSDATRSRPGCWSPMP